MPDLRRACGPCGPAPIRAFLQQALEEVGSGNRLIESAQREFSERIGGAREDFSFFVEDEGDRYTVTVFIYEGDQVTIR